MRSGLWECNKDEETRQKNTVGNAAGVYENIPITFLLNIAVSNFLMVARFESP